MPSLERRALVAVAAAASIVAVLGSGVAVVAAHADDLDGLSTALDEQKLREEIRALRRENTQEWWERSGNVAISAAFVAFFSAVAAFANQTRATTSQRTADREAVAGREKALAQQQDADRAQRVADRQRRYDELFAAASAQLASENEGLRLAAAVSIETAFLPEDASDGRRERDAYRAQVFTLLVSILRLAGSRASDAHLSRVLAKALRTQLPVLQPHELEPAPGTLRLDGVSLNGADLGGLDLRGVSFDDADLGDADLGGCVLTQCRFRNAFLAGATCKGVRAGKAVFRKADLEEADLSAARLRGAHFDDARLVAANLRRADLTNAKFRSAKLQSAHFDAARFGGRDTTFEDANLADAWFVGARGEGPEGALDDVVLTKLLRAEQWWDAHWDADVRTRLETLAAELEETEGV